MNDLCLEIEKNKTIINSLRRSIAEQDASAQQMLAAQDHMNV